MNLQDCFTYAWKSCIQLLLGGMFYKCPFRSNSLTLLLKSMFLLIFLWWGICFIDCKEHYWSSQLYLCICLITLQLLSCLFNVFWYFVIKYIKYLWLLWHLYELYLFPYRKYLFIPSNIFSAELYFDKSRYFSFLLIHVCTVYIFFIFSLFISLNLYIQHEFLLIIYC